MNSRNAPNLLSSMPTSIATITLAFSWSAYPQPRCAGQSRSFTNCCTRFASSALRVCIQSVALDNPVPTSTPTYYQHLRDHDYRVGCVGKLNLAKDDPQSQ